MARRNDFFEKQIDRLRVRINCVERNIDNLRQAIEVVDNDKNKVVTLSVINHYGDYISFSVTKNTVAQARSLKRALRRIVDELWIKLSKYSDLQSACFEADGKLINSAK